MMMQKKKITMSQDLNTIHRTKEIGKSIRRINRVARINILMPLRYQKKGRCGNQHSMKMMKG